MKTVCKIFFLLFPFIANAQYDPNWGYITRDQADSLKKALVTEKNDTVAMAANRSLGFFYQESNPDSAVFYHQKQFDKAQHLKIKMWLADAYSQLGSLYALKGNFNKSYEYLIEADKISSDEKNESSNWRPYFFSNARNLHEARISIKAINHNALAGLYGDVGEFAKQMAGQLEAIRLGESINNNKVLSLVYMNLADIYTNDSIIWAASKSIAYAKKAGYKKFLGFSYLQLARGYLLTQQYDSARKYIEASAAWNMEQNNLRGLAISYWALSIYYSGRQQNDSSLLYARKSLAVSEAANLPQRTTPMKKLAESFELKNMPDSAYKYEKLANIINDSLNRIKIGELTEYQNIAFNEQLRLKQLNDDKTAAQNQLKLYLLIGGIVALLIVAIVLYRNNRQKQQVNKKLEKTLSDLTATQQQLVQSEKMASLGELTAGIAHEIQNPLNFVNNFSELNKELIDELVSEVEKGNTSEVKLIATDIKDNSQKINHHGKRADSIVKGMLQHSRNSSGQKEPTDINALVDEYLRLAYHGLRAKDKSFNAKYEADFDKTIGTVNIVAQDIGRVVMNLLTNAFYACLPTLCYRKNAFSLDSYKKGKE